MQVIGIVPTDSQANHGVYLATGPSSLTVDENQMDYLGYNGSGYFVMGTSSGS
jgi:hypothetical protein